MTIDELLDCLHAANLHGIDTDDWTDWKALQDRYLTYAMKERMSRDQRLRLHQLTHISTVLADPEGTWTDQLSERLEREFRASLDETAVQSEARAVS